MKTIYFHASFHGEVAGVKVSVKANYFHASFRRSLHYFYGKIKWMFRGVVHGSRPHGAVCRNSVPGSSRGRDRSFHRLKRCMYLPEISHGSYWHVHVQNVKGLITSPSGTHAESFNGSMGPVHLSSSHGLGGISRAKLHAFPPPK